MQKRTRDDIEIIVNALEYKFLDEYSKNNNRIIIFKDKDGYKYSLSLNHIIFKKRISPVHKRNPFSLENISLWLIKSNKFFKLNEGNIYNGNSGKLIFHCFKCDDDFCSNWDYLHAGTGCPICNGKQVGKRTNLGYLRGDLIEEWSKKNLFSPFDAALFSGKKVWWKCKLCEYEWKTRIIKRTKDGQGCPACAGKIVTDKNRLSILYPKVSISWHPTKNNDVTPRDVSYGSNKKFWWICPICNFEWIESLCTRSNKGGGGCPKCSSVSIGNEIVKYFLIKSKINFVPEFRFNDCKNKNTLPFDFYLPDYNLLIEYQGEQHYFVLDNNRFGDEKDLLECQKRDKIKSDYCIKNNIPLITIPYWDFNNIERILVNDLNL